MSNSSSVNVVVISSLDDHVEAINTTLRDAGHAAHCIKVQKLGDLEAAIVKQSPELIVMFGAPNPATLQPVTDSRDNLAPHIPLLLVVESVTEDCIASAMKLGARDAVSLTNIERLSSVATRELRACRMENALERVMNSAKQYRNELNSLKQVSVEAIADIQEGIIVNANPAWLERFGRNADEDLTGEPIMDLCAGDDQPALKGALVACQRGKWSDAKLNVKGLRADKRSFPVSFSLENVEHDGEPAVRMLVAPDLETAKTPVSLIENAIQRDQATGFYTRQHFMHQARQRLEQPPAVGVRAIAYLRPDRFSQARDDLGLMGTEAVISQLAQILGELVQATDIYGRFGGTMFAVVAERGTMADVEAWARQLLDTIAGTVFEYEERSTALTCSIGLCESDAGADLADLLSEAERACRAARLQGGDRITLSESSGAAKKVRQDDSIWVPRIRGALMDNRFRLEHQPIASLNAEIDGAYDTLIRMLDEEGNTILPSEFMAAAERTGLSKNVDRWVIGASLGFAASAEAQLVFVRLSKDSLLDDDLFEWLRVQTASVGVAPSSVCLEVDHEVVAKHLRQSQLLAENLRNAGYKFAVEHFGKGDTATNILGKVPMDYIKIDGSLMQGLHKNSSAQNRVKEYARAARSLKVQTIAERVQDANTMAVLWQLGISYIQGNYVQSSEIVIEDTMQTAVTTRALSLETES